MGTIINELSDDKAAVAMIGFRFDAYDKVQLSAIVSTISEMGNSIAVVIDDPDVFDPPKH